jgi:hypothetical protein
MDPFPLKFLLDQKITTIPQHQWVNKLLGFDFTVEYKPGTTNTIADALSRCDTEAEASLRALSVPAFQLFDDLRGELDSDKALRALKEEVIQGLHDDK